MCVTHISSWSDSVAHLNEYTALISKIWCDDNQDPDSAKSALQQKAHMSYPDEFPMNNETGTSIASLCELVLSCPPDMLDRKQACSACGCVRRDTPVTSLVCTVNMREATSAKSTAGLVRHFMNHPAGKCTCGGRMQSTVSLRDHAPRLLAVSTSETTDITASMSIDYDTVKVSYRLAGVVYHGNNHFTARIVDRQKRVWSHDGMRHDVSQNGLRRYNAGPDSDRYDVR